MKSLIFVLLAMVLLLSRTSEVISNGLYALVVLGIVGILVYDCYFPKANTRNKPKYMPAGLAMLYFGGTFFVVPKYLFVISIPVAAWYCSAGLVLVIRGLAEHLNLPPRKKHKKPWNHAIYIGISLVIGGYASVFRLFAIKHALLVIGMAMIFAGLITILCGIRKLANDTKRVSQTVKPVPVVYSPTKLITCIRCGKKMTDFPPESVCSIDDNICCIDCKKEIEKARQELKMVCNKCGKDLTNENANLIDGELFCQRCIERKYGEIEF